MTLLRSHGMVGALVPWKSSSACSSGTPVRELLLRQSGGIGRVGIVGFKVVYFVAWKREEGDREAKYSCQWSRLAREMASRNSVEAALEAALVLAVR